MQNSHEDLNKNLDDNIEFIEEDTIDSLDDDFIEVSEYDDDFSTNDYVIINLVETWRKQQIADRALKKKYGIWIMIILIIELIFMASLLIAIGLQILTFDEWVINAFIITTFGQIMGVVYLIVKNLFSSGNQIIDIIKEYIK